MATINYHTDVAAPYRVTLIESQRDSCTYNILIKAKGYQYLGQMRVVNMLYNMKHNISIHKVPSFMLWEEGIAAVASSLCWRCLSTNV